MYATRYQGILFQISNIEPDDVAVVKTILVNHSARLRSARELIETLEERFPEAIVEIIKK